MAPTEVGPALPLQVDGRHSKGSAGDTIVLRPVSQHGFLDVPDGAWVAPGEELYAAEAFLAALPDG